MTARGRQSRTRIKKSCIDLKDHHKKRKNNNKERHVNRSKKKEDSEDFDRRRQSKTRKKSFIDLKDTVVVRKRKTMTKKKT